MKKLRDKIKQIENVLYSLEKILKKENVNLINPNHVNIDMLELIEKKRILLKNFNIFSQERLLFEKKYNVSAPYKEIQELNYQWNRIVNKCLLLKNLNLENKIIINKRFYLNQRFLESFESHKTAVTYTLYGNIKKI